MNRAAIWPQSVLIPSPEKHSRLVETVLDEIDKERRNTAGVSRHTLQQERECVLWILEALIHATTSIPLVPLALPRSPNKHGSSHRTHVPLPYKPLSRALLALERLGWLRCEVGFRDSHKAQVSRYWTQGELLAHCKMRGQEWSLRTPPPPESLILIGDRQNGKPRRAVHDHEGPCVALWRKNLLHINETLLSHCVMLNATDEVIEEAATVSIQRQLNDAFFGPVSEIKKVVVPMHFGNVTLKRIFARNRLDFGGRFYGGWWMHIPSSYRRYIYIDNCPTVECDYSGIALRCLYAREGLDIGSADPYDIGLPNYQGKNDPRRSIVKEYINAALNDIDKKYKLPESKCKMLGVTGKQLRTLLAARHSSIASHFHTGVGLELQFIDSQIAESVMLRFVEMGEAILPIHDSFIVRKELHAELERVMREEFERITGQKCPISHDLGLEYPSHPVFSAPSSSESDIIQAAKRLSDSWLARARQFTISDRYLFSWANQAVDPPQTEAAQSARRAAYAIKHFASAEADPTDRKADTTHREGEELKRRDLLELLSGLMNLSTES